MKIGYARVSTLEQNADLQVDALLAAGCERVFQEQASGGSVARVELDRCLDALRPGDVLVVWRLDRLGRSLKHLVETVTGLQNRQVGFESLTEKIETSTSTGKLVFHLFAALSEFERDIIKERTLAGLAASRARGRIGGRPQALSSEQIDMAWAAVGAGAITISEVAKSLGVSRGTIYNAFRRKEGAAS